MKQLIPFTPAFNPTNKTLDFAQLSEFDIKKLYAVINITQNAIIYASGAPSIGAASVVDKIVTLQYNTTSHNVNDKLNVYYETGYETRSTDAQILQTLNTINETLKAILLEQKIHTLMFADAFSFKDDINQIKSQINSEYNDKDATQ